MTFQKIVEWACDDCLEIAATKRIDEPPVGWTTDESQEHDYCVACTGKRAARATLESKP